MLSTGDMDDNVHMANTMRLADALIKANQRFDMFMLPGQRVAGQRLITSSEWYLLGDWDQRVDMTEVAPAGKAAEIGFRLATTQMQQLRTRARMVSLEWLQYGKS